MRIKPFRIFKLWIVISLDKYLESDKKIFTSCTPVSQVLGAILNKVYFGARQDSSVLAVE